MLFWLRAVLGQDLQELGLLKETIVQKAAVTALTPKLSSICHQLRQTRSNNLTNHVISCHIHLYVLRWRTTSHQLLYTTLCLKIHTDTISNDQAERRQVSELSSALERLQQEQLGEASAISTFLEHFLIWKKL